MSHFSRHASLACLVTGLIVAGAAQAQEPAMADDPYQWLEDVAGEKPLDWVRARNAESDAALASTPEFKRMEASIREVLDSDARIPGVYKMGDYYYNFWKDKNHQRGLWRRTTLEEYRKPNPAWETLLDLDALNRAEGENWVWHGADCLPPDYERCLVALSRGGADADVTREFDLPSKSFVEGGFYRPEAKGRMAWIDRDHVYLVTASGPDSVNRAGYARVAREWKRGAPMEEAMVVFEGPADNAGYGIYVGRDHTPGFERDYLLHYLDSRDTAFHLRDADGRFVKVDAPDSASKSVHREWLMLELRDPWQVGGRDYKAGSLLAIGLDDFQAGKRDFDVLFEPDERTSLAGFTPTRNHVVLNVFEDVKNRISVLTHGAGGWTSQPLKIGGDPIGTTSVGAVDADESDLLWVTTAFYLTPNTLMLADAADPAAPAEALKSMPEFFDASRHVVEQHFATSKDGTRVPYFLVRPRDLAFDGTTPTLLYGYGGFEVSRVPGYSGGLGRAWLDKGGVYAVANIRGGGEYGPRWHQAALKQHRHKAYEDFAAVAQDLVARGITSPRHLGVQGGSNGGLLTGNMLVQYPELFGAVVVQVPLLDMKRYHKLLAGASWMGEYGDPDSDDWSFIRGFSPYHLFDPGRDYPPVLFTTSTRDDRVHPGHARKMAAKMIDAGKDVTYYENIEGGHGGAADNAQAAHMSALAYGFLWDKLSR